MLNSLHRHPFAVQAFFRRSLVLTFAFPEALLQTLLPPCLRVDAYEGWGFLAIALVETEQLRPAGWPSCLGQNFFLSGYRIFSRYQRRDGRILRGLRILRSYTDRRSMMWSGNLFTRYNYRHCHVMSHRSDDAINYTITTARAEADLRVRARIDKPATAPPAGSPFPNLRVARRFAGPLPFTFGYEAETSTMIIVQGVREHWEPLPVAVDEVHSSFLADPIFAGTTPRLANAFYMKEIPYLWKRGEVESVADANP